MATDTAHRTTTVEQPDGVLSRAAQQLRQFMCGLHGHDSLLHFERGRMSLLCMSCGYETPGWDVKSAATTRPQGGDAKPRVVSMPLVRERRVA